ncbi:MAG: nucleotide pyrophosphohydrolase [Methanosarcinales archaeon]|nr:nucleotide pyrophosphohydrolase [Methanosarcinales archaeon]
MEEIQNKVREFCEENDMEAPIEHRVLDLMSELGEASKEVLKMSDYGKKSIQFREEIKGELGDVFYSLITVANYFDINLEESLNIAIEKYEERLKKGSAGSENN